MRKNIIILLITTVFMLVQGCGQLLQEPGMEPTLEQKMRGIWIVGGLSTEYITSTVAQVDLYDPVTDKYFSGVTTMPVPVSFAGIAAHGNSIYVIGGFTQTGVALTTVQIYNVIDDSWSTGQSLAQARANIDAVTIYDKIYIVNGTVNNAENTTFTTVNYVYSYDTTTDSWSNYPTSPGVCPNATCFALNDILYYLGGRSSVTAAINTHQGYLTSISPAGAVTSYLETAIPSGRIGVAGVMYKPSSGPPMEILIGGYSAISTITGNYIFNNDQFYNATQVSDVRYLTNQFTTAWSTPGSVENYPHNLGFASAVVYNNKLYCFGGASIPNAGSLTVYNDVNCLDLSNFPTGSWVGQSNMPVGRFGHVAVKIR